MPKKLLFIAPLPPPVNGFSNISEQMFRALSERFEVVSFNQSPSLNRGLLRTFGEVVRVVWQLGRFVLCLIQFRDSVMYIAFSGGMRQVIDLSFIALARLFRVRIFIHHHSFGYLNSPRVLTRVIFRCAGAAHHIALCHRMKKLLSVAYRLNEDQVFILSNAAFVSEDVQRVVADRRDSSTATLGFCGNITREKGIMDFFALIRACATAEVLVTGIIAGPLDENIAASFFAELEHTPNVKYWGSVYGNRKDDFFRTIDLLVFPSRYANEAEPVTILEAAAAGAAILATGRGCIGEMLEVIEGKVVPDTRSFPDMAVGIVATLARRLEDRPKLRSQAQQCFRQMRMSSLSSLTTLMDRLEDGPPRTQ